jgi:cytochrome c
VSNPPPWRPLRAVVATALLAAWMLAPTVASAGDASAGADVFKSECAECHSVKEGKNKKGPSLFGIVGRKAGSLPDYDYSDAVRKTSWTWTAEQLHSYLSQPAKQANPGTKMKYDGLTDAKDLDNLISYLGSLH